MSALPPVRRIVTGHTPSGKAIIDSDTTFTPFDPRVVLSQDKTAVAPPARPEEPTMDKGGFILLWRTDGFPASVQGLWEEYHNKLIPLSDETSTVVRIVDMPPGLSSPLHRTVSLDLGVVMTGEVVLEMDDGVETVVKQGETVIQRGTIHAWHNRTQEMVRILFVLVPSKKVVVGGEVLDKTQFNIN